MKKRIALLIAALSAVIVFRGTLLARITGTQPTSPDIFCTGPDGAEVCIDASGNIVPTTSNDASAGSSSLRWSNVFTTLLNASGAATLGGTLDVTGAVTFTDGLETGDIDDSAITSNKLTSSAVTNAKIAADAVTSDKIPAATIGTVEILDSAVTSDKVTAGAVTNVKLGADAVTSDKILAGSVGTPEIVDSVVTSAKLASDSVTLAKIVDSVITSAKLAGNSVAGAAIIDGVISSPKLASSAVSSGKFQGMSGTSASGKMLCAKDNGDIGSCTLASSSVGMVCDICN